MSERDIASRAATLRREFDEGFARPIAHAPAVVDYVLAGIGTGSYAVRLSEIAGVYRDRTVTRVPSRSRHLLGVAAFRGLTAPIYDLREILGHPATSAPRWIALAQAKVPVGFAFDALEMHLRVEADAMRDEPSADAGALVRGVVHAEGRSFPVLRLASVFGAVRESRGVPTGRDDEWK